MRNNLYKIEKDLRSIAKRYKSIKYSIGLAILFLMLGVSAFSEEVITEKTVSQVATREELKTSVGDVQTRLNVLRDDNEKEIKNLKLELIQLMEQGNQVIKSPWASWQFGMNYFYENWGNTYKGRGDKSKKYIFNGIYVRGDWKERNAMDALESQKVAGDPLTPGNDSLNTWKNTSTTSSGGVKIEKNTAINSSTNGNRSWGLVDLLKIKEPTNEVEILARISPKEVNKKVEPLDIKGPEVKTIPAPIVKPEPNKPIEAPKINLPNIKKVTIEALSINPPSAPGAISVPSIGITIATPSKPVPPSVSVSVNEPSVPSISVDPSTPSSPKAPTIDIEVTPPSISSLNIVTPGNVGTIGVTTPTVTAVNFILPEAELSSEPKNKFMSGSTYNLNGKTVTVDKVNLSANPNKGNYISTWGKVKGLDGITTDVIVTKDSTRAFMVDEGINDSDSNISPFRFKGNIILKASKNVGIDVQGTHTRYSNPTNAVITDNRYKDIKNVANIKVTNAGNIIGETGTGVENQVAFGFNNFDSSTNNTRTEMINVGNVTLNAPKSAGIQLRPENPNNNHQPNDQKGLNMMTARNEKEVIPNEITGTININSYGSFGMLTVENKNATTSRDYKTTDYKTKTSVGGQFANRAQVENMSFMKNTGVINIDGDSSIGVGHLHNIQAVYVGGTINIGKNDPTNLTSANKGSTTSKTEGAVGVYTSVETRPVLKNKYDDHGLQNTTGATVGTETVEVFGTINLEEYAKGSIGLYAKDKGSITLKNNSTVTTSSTDENVKANINKGIGIINVGGENNYGAVVDTIKYKSKQKEAQNQYETESTTDDKIGRIDLEKDTLINVTGKESIAYVLKNGEGSNKGIISVKGHESNNNTGGFHGSLGFYGEKGSFTNEEEGTIYSYGTLAHAVALIGDTTDGFIFNNKGIISAAGDGNIGVYADKKYIFNHQGPGRIYARPGAVGIYAKNSTNLPDTDSKVNINATIDIDDSSTNSTSIGIYSDGKAHVGFGSNSKLIVGTGAVGLYSADATKFKDTFKVESGKKLEVDLGTNSTFGLFNATSPTILKAGEYLRNNTIDITSFGTGASIFYTTGGATTEIDKNYTVSNTTAGTNASTSVLVGTKGSTVKVNNGINLTTGTNVGLIATKGSGTGAASSTAINDGVIKSTRVSKGIAIYTNDSTATNSATGSILMDNTLAVGMLGENNSTLTNDGKIELAGTKSTGIYGKDSDITNTGTGTTPQKGIFVKKEKSAGIYALLTAGTNKTVSNTGLIKLEGATETGSAGIYAKLTSTNSKLTTQNSGDIELVQTGSAGIYADNVSSQNNAQSEVTNTATGLIKVDGESSVGIIGKKSKITNLGTGAKGIEVKAIKSAGILGNIGSTVINSARILLEANVTNSVEGLVGVSVDYTSTGTNDTNGTIEVKADYSSGMSSTGGLAKNEGKIQLINASTVGILSTNANAENNGLTTSPAVTKGIIIENDKSVGIFARLNGAGSVDKTIKNNGTISVGGTSKKGSAGIYSILENGSIKKITTLNTTTANIDVSQEEAVGIYVRNSSTQLNSQSVAENAGKIVVSSEGSAGILAYKSEVTNSGASTSLPTFDKGISLTAKKTAGIIGKNGSKIINTGDIVLNSTVQPTLATEGLVGISIDEISSDDKLSQEYINSNGFSKSTVTNDGTITINTAYSTGISGKGGFITNNKNIILNKEKSVGIASTDGNVLNSLTTGKIEVKESNSVGIFAKLTENTTSSQTITNEGLITLNGGNTKTSSVGIYSLIEDKAVQAGKAQTIKNTGTIGVGTKSSAGIYVKDNRTIGEDEVSFVRNEGTINVTEESSAGIIGEYSQITNGNPQTKNGVIELSAKKTAGIIANKKSKVMNYGTIETTAFSVGIGEGLVGISADNSTVINKNKEDSTGMIGTITLNTAYSTGIYGKNESTLVNEGEITAKETDSIGMAGENSLLTNKNIILLEEEKSVGMFGTTDGTKTTVVTNERDDINNLTGTITTKKKKSVGIFVSTEKASAINKGTILIEEEKSAGMYGDEANIENTGDSTALVASITTKKDESAGMYAKNSNAINKKKITIEGKDSAGILVELTKDNKEITGTNDVADNSAIDKDNGLIEIKNKNSVGMLGTVAASVTTATSKLTLSNKKAINVDNESSVGMMLENNSTNVVKANVTAENTGVITLKNSATNKENIGILAKKNSTAINKDNGIINVNSVKSIGILAKEGSKIENNTTIPANPPGVGQEYGINLKAEDGVGMLAEGKNSKNEVSTAVNNGKINIISTAKKSIGMLAQNEGDVKNKKEIEISAEEGVGIFVSETGTGENVGTNGEINILAKKSVGIFAKNNGNTHTAKNSGTINLGKTDGTTTDESLIGMFTQADSGKIASVKNEAGGIINVNTKKSVGIYANNNPANAVGDVDLHNAGTININNTGSAGIYAPKTTVSKVGKINLKNSDASNGSSAVYVSEGGKVEDTSTAEINLGTANQNRVAYYVNGANSILRSGISDNIGKISGYGVGVYLEGDSKVGTAKIDKNTPKLHFTNATLGTTGNGIIGLFLSGDTKIESYTKGIVVGNTVQADPTIANDEKKYAIGIYADKQGTTGSHYKINTDVTTGKEGVGIFSDSNSVIDYKGHITVGDGTTTTKDDEVTAGIGIYITKSTAGNTGTVNLVGSKTDTSITLKGTGGVAVIASEDTKFDGGNATINLVGTDVKGVGVYAKKGSDVNIDNWTFNNNGNAAEEVRSEEGKANINATLKELKPKMVLSHVINGETSISSSTTVVSVDDLPYKAAANIGLMAEGIKNPAMTWVKGNYEIVNDGIINFSAAEKSTAIYVNSARVKNNKDIKVGKNSTAIYGFYDKNTRKYDGAPTSSDPNKLTVETTATSNISLGDSSTGMYLINAETVTNATGSQITSTSGATKNVGIYAINGAVDKETVAETTAYNVLENYKKLTMTIATDINLGDGSVGLYSKGQDKTTIPTAIKNEVINTGNITVGKTLTNAPAVAVYAENTKLTNGTASATPTITVGEKGIAFYGKNSEIEAKGTVNYSNKGILAYLEKSNFTSHYGNLTAHQNTMLFLINSIANMNGAGTDIDITVPDKATTSDSFAGVYVEGKSELNGVKKIEIGKNSNGIFLKDAEFESNVDDIISTKEGAKALLATNSNLINNSKINLSGDNSIGIYSNADATKNVTNNGELTIAGKKTLGVFLKGGQSFENTANINIADSADSQEPTIGIYAADGTSNIKHTTGTIEVGEKSIGIYSKTSSNVEMDSGKIHVKDQAIGIYKENGKLTVKGELEVDKHVATAKDTEPVGVYGVNGAEVVDQASKITVGEKSYGFILNNTDPNKTNVYTNINSGPVSLGNDSVFLYSNGKADITNNRNINSNNSDHLIGFYVKNGGELTNNGTIDFSTGKGNIGIYTPNGKATNKGNIFVGPTDDIDPATGKIYSDPTKIVYGIGMAADNGGHIINEGNIKISDNKSIGMYGAGVGTTVENKGNILLDGSKATATNKIGSLTGVYVDDGATFRNYGTIKTTDSYAGRNGKVNDNVAGLVGVAVMNGSTLINEATGSILIDADNSTGVIIRGKRDADGKLIRKAIIKNYGEIRVRGDKGKAISWKDLTPADITELERQINAKLISTDPKGHELGEASGTDKDYQGVSIIVKNGKASFLRNGVPVPDSEVEKINKLIGNQPNLAMSDVGFYVDTLGKTKPVTFDGVAPPVYSQLIIGTEYSERTNKKEWLVSGDVIKPFLEQIQGRNYKITTLAASLTWIATPVLDNYGQIVGVGMTKIDYKNTVNSEDNAYNFTDGLEQRYNVNPLGSAEKRLFTKLDAIGKNEETVLTQAYDEMMGHQYANVQQRIQATGRILDKEFSYLRNSWSNPSKDSNKVKTFGMKGEYKTDTAGIIDYKNNAYGVAYVHEDETVKLGESTGWYTGIVHNTFKFEDIGKSKEEQLQAKVGIFKSVPFDHNNSLNWTISGDIFVGYNKLNRKFLVVDEIFQAKSKYYTYGIGIKNEIGKEFRLTEGISVRPYGALKVEYGRMSKIKEKSGEMKLEVKENDYLSIKPEVGTELAYKLYFGNKALKTAVVVAYENELGRVANGKNKARVVGTTADWFNIRGEKEDRKGNAKADLNIGIDNQRFGITGNIGYDTKGNNVRGGLGLRVIF